MVEGRKVIRNAMELMMTRKKPTRKISRTIDKKMKGAKSTSRKGKIMWKIETDSSQPGMERFLYRGKGLIGTIGMDNGFGRKNSLGSSRMLIKPSCQI